MKFQIPMVSRIRRKPRLSSFARLLLAEWRKLKLPIDAPVVIGVSGGADSTGLLLGLEELIKANELATPVCVAHLDHGIRKGSRKDAEWVSDLAANLGFDSVVGRARVLEVAQEN